MTNHFTISVNNFYKAIIIAFFFSVTLSNDLDNVTKCLWVKSDELLNNSIESIITNAYRSEYKIIYLQLIYLIYQQYVFVLTFFHVVNQNF